MTGTAILVLGHARPHILGNTLESLRRQDAIGQVHIWIDGHQGFDRLQRPVYLCREEAARHPEARVTAYNGHVGIDKLMLDALASLLVDHERIIVLEDDCFPAASAIRVFENELDTIAGESEIFSTYGHHYLVPDEGETITCFQCWGWATTRDKLAPVLEEARECFSWPESRYLAWVEEQLTLDVRSRLEVALDRNPVDTMTTFYSWDAVFALLTAKRQLVHKKTSKRVVYNCGMGEESGHFALDDRFRQLPFNLIGPDEVWDVFEDADDWRRSPSEENDDAGITHHVDSYRSSVLRLHEIHEAAVEKESALGGLRRELEMQTRVAAERLELIEQLSRERDVQAAAAAERLAMLNQISGRSAGCDGRRSAAIARRLGLGRRKT